MITTDSVTVSRPSSVCAMKIIRLVQAYTTEVSLVDSAAELARAIAGGMQCVSNNIRKSMLGESAKCGLGSAAGRSDGANQVGDFALRLAHQMFRASNRLQRHPDCQLARDPLAHRRIRQRLGEQVNVSGAAA